MSLIWKIALIPLGLILAWDVFVIVAANQPRPWLWIVRRPHYEVTFSVNCRTGYTRPGALSKPSISPIPGGIRRSQRCRCSVPPQSMGDISTVKP